MDKPNSHFSRRKFMQGAALIGATPLMKTRTLATDQTMSSQTTQGAVPKKPLGRTGVQISALGLGGYHLGSANTDQVVNEIVAKALDHGIDFFDNCLGISRRNERRKAGQRTPGQEAQAHSDDEGLHAWPRQKTSPCAVGRIATPIKDGSSGSLADSRSRLLRTIPISSSRPVAPPKLYSRQRNKGKVRFIGFTGHKDPDIHLKMLSHDFPFDTVQMPLNCSTPRSRVSRQQVLPEAREARHCRARHEEPGRQRRNGRPRRQLPRKMLCAMR